ncbi:hypothetical protein ABW20_dc0109322 [Dactylellina cionopaga]|nr:hypothetical protein ABW20_dc0109322 [Dactylellina cionopaga]
MPSASSTEGTGALTHRQDSMVIANTGFAQTGNFNWLEFLGSSVSFQIEQVTRARLGSVVEKLESYKGFGDLLWYGFGIDNPIRKLNDTEPGMVLCGLCGALAECYEEKYCAHILNELTELLSPPEDRTPSLLQWEEVARTCSGFLARTGFANLVDDFIRLSDPYVAKPFKTTRAADMADALFAIAAITRGELQSITIKGNHHAALLAAVAEWLFSLSICIMADTGELLYPKDPSFERNAQVTIIFTALEANAAVERIANTYILSEPTEIFQPLKTQTTGRVLWDQALTLTFGPDFEELLTGKLVKQFAAVLRYVAATLDVIHMIPEAKLHEESYRPNQKASTRVSAQELVGFMCTCFPELEPLQKRIYNASARTDVHKISTEYMKNIASIRKECACQVCREPKTKEANDRQFCLEGLVATVLRLSVSLSNIEYPPDLLPRRSGLLLFYQRRFDAYISKNQGFNIRRSARDVVVCIKSLYCHVERRNKDCDPLIQDALIIFGSGLPDSKTQALDVPYSAAAVNGICAWSSILCGISESEEISGRVHVAPGRIEYKKRSHTLIRDQILEAPLYGPDQRDRLNEYNRPSMLIQETVDALYIAFTLYANPLRQSTVVTQKQRLDFRFGPAQLLRFVEMGRGLVKCNISNCGRKVEYVEKEGGDSWKEIQSLRVSWIREAFGYGEIMSV